MEEKKSIKVSLGTVICIVIIFILIMALAGMYVYYNYIPRENVTNTNGIANNNETVDNTDVNITEPTITSLSVDSESVKQLYDYILKFNYYGETLVYQSNKVTSTNIDNQLKLLTAFANLDESQAKKVKVEKDDPQYDFIAGVEDDGNVYKYIYQKETIEQKVQEIFGKNSTVIHEDCSPHDGYSRDYENGVYTCYQYEGGGDVPWSMSESKIVKAETDGNNIYLYDTYVHRVEVDNIINGVNHSGTYDIYATSDRNILIATKIESEKESLYADKIKTFKHTFSKDSNGNYCWVSTEIAD